MTEPVKLPPVAEMNEAELRSLEQFYWRVECAARNWQVRERARENGSAVAGEIADRRNAARRIIDTFSTPSPLKRQIAAVLEEPLNEHPSRG